jgi:thioester reductase-like protein
LASKLTDYMVPTAYMQMDKLPLTPNGKVNRKALPVPEITSNAIYEELAEGMETTIARIFGKVLNRERVGANDNFFEIGGTSLNAIKVIVEAKKQKVPFILNDLFTQKTPRALASYITRRTENGSENQANEDDGPMPSEANDSSLSPLNALLHDNTLDAFRRGERQPIGDVLLTGATGFLGIHVLKRLLNHYDGKIYCPVRCGKGEDPLHKIKNLFFYYFDDQDFDALEKRVVAFAAEITQPGALDSLQVEGLTVVNCVANVKHFSSGKDIEFVNIESVRHLINFCLRTHSRLIHVSTMSVAGQSVDGSPSPDVQFTEQDFDIGQHVKSNQYVNSKFEAERLVLQAIQDHGLQAKIMRVGNLSARTSDGEFQINFNSNNAMALLRVQALLRAIPYETLEKPFECSPIDETAQAILLLAETPKECIVFHPYNNHTILTADILKGFEKSGIHIQEVESDQFQQILNEALMNEDMSMLLRPLLAYDNDRRHRVTEVRHSNSYTTQVLYRLGFSWQQTDQNYVAQFVKALAGLGYFDISLLKKLNA